MSVKSINSAGGFFRYQNLKILFFLLLLLLLEHTMATNMEIAVSYPASKFEADNTITNPKVLEKYQLAADVVNGN
jgi:hypothetical protein